MKMLRVLVIISLSVSLTACTGHTESPTKQSKTKTQPYDSSTSARKGKGQMTSTTPQSNPKPKSKDSALLSVSNEWPSFGNNLWQDRYSPDVTITPKTITRLSLAFQKTLPNTLGQNEAYPLEEKGILYVTAPGARVLALNAETGKIIWSFTPKLTTSHFTKANRGVALGPDRVFDLTPDDQLIALQKSNGNKLFDVKVADFNLGYFETMAPQYADGKVFVGSSGGDMGVRGFVEAFDATSGKRLWRFYTIPKRGQGWVPKKGDHGGGAVWTTPTYDPETKQLFFGTGNPSPDYFGESRKGSNLYTDSVVSLGVTNGKLNWYAQEVSHDLWDYDVASPPMLFNLNGKRVIGEAGKDGFWYEWTSDDGKAIIDPVAFVKQDHSPPTASGTKVWPGPAGGANYGPSAYDPNTQTVFVAGIDGPETLYAKPTDHKGHASDFGTHQDEGQTKDWKGTITAINVETGKKKWQTHTDSPPIGGVTVNAGGVVFFGQANGELDGLNAKTGEVVWKVKTSTSIGSAPILYENNGRTYLTFVTGGAGSLLRLFPNHNANDVRSYKLK
jgi:alcohol dehydrogenase (cytochrome c)